MLAFKRLERSEAKVSRCVLRGLDLGNEIWLLDQKDIAKEIINQGADYVLSLKENQKTL